MNTRKKRELAGTILDYCSFRSPEPKKRKSSKKEPAAKPTNLSSSGLKSSVEKSEKINEKYSSVSEDASFVASITNIVSIGSDDWSAPYSYETINTGATEKG